ncbi:collagen alpha-2(I) chain-like [Hyla sarda]|uniref:collagen alpha-2(I) chain-like n=1 Tax=Hyla sarda TaxID=327740 RepID=UPI0024C308CC|nr:collagen alpha-2(I) chain-like [Hyla sarda]XP_056425206.1 collagen alpha-2(I) chain-like [Hyla sarda]XP_056427509.1 collagen alpha-2(I) chain-like [Hyla sarda]XP_056427516.1 collagen alpha-2(I) chain-like [Hyla sarda]
MEDSCEEDAASGGLLRAIVQQESPTRFEDFAFGEDLGKNDVVKKRKKQKVQETVSFVFHSFKQSGPAVKLVQAAGPPKLPDPVPVMDRGQQGGYSMASEKAVGAIDVKPTHPAGREGQDGLMVGSGEASYAAACSGGGSPSAVGITGAAGHSPVRGGSVQAPLAENGGSRCSGGGPPSTICSVGAAGHSSVREGSVRVSESAAEPVRTGTAGTVGIPCVSESVGGAGVRPGGQLQTPEGTSPMEEEPLASTPATAKTAKNIIKPAILQVPASPESVRQRPPGWEKVIGS